MIPALSLSWAFKPRRDLFTIEFACGAWAAREIEMFGGDVMRMGK